jgi:signal peptide peptidase SppA
LAKHLKDADKEAPPLTGPETSQFFRTVQERAWALLPAKLDELNSVVERRLAGDKLDFSLAEAGKSGNRAEEPYQIVDGVAVLPVYGVLDKRMNLLMAMSGGTSTELLARDFKKALADPEATAILLDIESPGGAVDGVKEVADLIYQARGRKPVVAFGNDLMASGAYWIGSAATTVMATETAILGSIGVAMMHYDLSGRDAQAGIKRTAIFAGKYKRIASDEKPLSAEGQAYLQGMVDQLYGIFVEAVARQRQQDPDTVQATMADGRLFIGNAARQAGLIDKVGTFEAALALARKLGGKNMDRKTLEAQHPELFQEIKAIGAAEIEAAADDFRAEGRDGERARVLDILMAPGAAALKLQAVQEGLEPKEAFKLMLDQQEVEKAKALAALAEAAPPALGQEVETHQHPGRELPLEQRALVDWENDPKLVGEFKQFETYLAFRRAEEAGRAKIKTT